MLESFRADISYMQDNLPECKKAKAKELEEHRIRAEYLHYEVNNTLGKGAKVIVTESLQPVPDAPL